MCDHKKMISVNAKCNDLCIISWWDGNEHMGDVPKDIGIGGGDYVEFDYCSECGQIAGFPL